MLQGTPLDRSRAFRSKKQTPCTEWPRTVMRGKSRKLTSGPERVPKSARRTEPSSRNPRFAAHLQCVSAKEGPGSQEGTGNHWCPVPFCPCRWAPASPPPDGGIPAGEHRHPRPPRLFFLRRLCFPLFAVKIEGSLFLYTNDERIEEAVL